jgi:sugar/nucleoside kinase (ribokinase family)
VLLGPASIDRYIDEGRVLPGGGALNMAYHWAQRSVPFHFLTRIGDDHPALFTDFLLRHGIAHLPEHLIAPGASASIDIVIRDDRQPWMDNFVEGVWASLHLSADEERLIGGARHLHAVLVDPVVAEVERLGEAGVLDGVDVAADFLGFRHYTVDRFARTMVHVQLGVIGWPGDPDDTVIDELQRIALDGGSRLVVTLGAHGVRVADPARTPSTWFVPITAREVLGTTVGCGDAFIAALLAALWSDGDLDAAITAGAALGAEATAWLRPLPDTAY